MANLGRIDRSVLDFATANHQTLPGVSPAVAGDPWWWYKEQVKSFLPSQTDTSNRSTWACPSDRGYSDPKPFWQGAKYDSNSYVFNGVTLPGLPNILDWPVSAIVQPSRTLLVMEWTAHAPLSWHRSQTGGKNDPFYNNAQSVVGYVDGHTSVAKIYYDGFNAAYTRDPLPGYEYRYSGN